MLDRKAQTTVKIIVYNNKPVRENLTMWLAFSITEKWRLGAKCTRHKQILRAGEKVRETINNYQLTFFAIFVPLILRSVGRCRRTRLCFTSYFRIIFCLQQLEFQSGYPVQAKLIFTYLVPAKRSQHCWAQHVACVWPPCCDMLGVVGSSLKMVKFGPTMQHVAPNNVALTCCDRLAGAWKWSNLSQHPTRRNMVAKRTQHVAPNNIRCCDTVAIVWPGLSCIYIISVGISPRVNTYSQMLQSKWKINKK